MSISLAVLVMTFAMPYSVVTTVMSSANVIITEAERVGFTAGISAAYIWMAALNAIAIVPSMLRGKKVTVNQLTPQNNIGPPMT